MNSYTFIPGDPIPRPAKRFGNGRAYTPSNHPVHAWKEMLVIHFKTFLTPVKGGVELKLNFYFNRPKCHFNKSGLKKSAPSRHEVKPDADNLEKVVFDALQDAGIIENDSRIYKHTSCKEYTEDTSGLLINIR